MNGKDIKECLEILSEDSKIILCLIYACKENRVPEVVLGLLYAAANPSERFRESIYNMSMICGEYLEKATANSLAPTDDEPGEFHQRDFRAWSLKPSLRDYMDNNKAVPEKEWSLLDTLLGGPEQSGEHNRKSEKTRVVTALCALYLDHTHKLDVVRNAATRAATACSLIYSNDHIFEFRRAIEPIIFLLYPSVRYRMKESNLHYLRQIFLQYVYERQLDDASISKLLTLDRYALEPLAVLTAIERIYVVHKIPLLSDEHHLEFLEVLADHLKEDENVDITIVRPACDALYSISQFFSEAEDDESVDVVVNTPGILAALGRLIKEYIASNTPRSAERLAHAAICILRNLSTASEESTKLRILNEDGMIKVLAMALCKHDDTFLQEMAATTWGNLSCGVGYKVLQILNEHEETPTSTSENLPYQGEFISEDGALAGLMRLLANDGHPDLQEKAARALMHLTAGHGNGRERLNIQILKQPTVLADLLKSISKDDYPDLQQYAAGALMNLAFGPDSLRFEILQEDGAIAALVNSLSKDSKPDLQGYAAAALNYLAQGRESRNIEILKEPMAIVNLVRSLSKDDNLNLQVHTAEVFLSLSCAGESTKLRIVREDGVIAGLVRSLSTDACPQLQETAARALINLASGEELVQFELLEAGALAALVQSLLKDNRPRLQDCAAQALMNLSHGGEGTKSRILKEPMALANLVRSMSKDDNPNLQENAAEALCLLSTGGNSIKLQIVRADGALARLVSFLSNDDSPDLQGAAAGALMQLTTGEESLQLNILKEDGILAALAKNLLKDHNPSLQEWAAQTFTNLSYGGERIKLQIFNEPMALANLAKSLSKDSNPKLQENAAEALMILAARGKSVVAAFLKEEGVLVGIVSLLSKDDQPHLQSYGAAILGNLASGGESIKIHIINQDGALSGFVSCLLKGRNLPLQETAQMWDIRPTELTPSPRRCAARAVKILSRVENNSMKEKIRNEDGLLIGLADLAKCESEGDSSPLQQDATEALNNLVYIL